MARNIFGTVTERGVKSTFLEAMSKAPNVYLNHCAVVSSDAPDEKYAWLGALPIPRELLGAREFQQFNEFSHTVTNLGYELSFIIDRDSFADDQVGSIQGRIAELAEAYAQFKDSQFATLLINGETDNAFDGVTFHDTTRTINDSGTIDNSTTSAAASGTVPTLTELANALEDIIAGMHRFNDDKGRPFNGTAMQTLRAVIPPEQHRVWTELVNSTLIPNQADTASQSNPYFQGLLQFDVLDYLTTADAAIYIHALGAERKPFYFQQREPLEVVVLNGTNDVAENHGVKVLCYERYRFAYGDPRRAFRHDFS